MIKLSKCCLVVRRVMLVCGAFVALHGQAVPAAQPASQMLAHDVYFSLKDRSPQAKNNLIAACKKYLSAHPGTVWFAAGPLAAELKRDVNDLDFDVALHVVFRDKAAHDQYQKAEMHLKFIEENQQNWKKVRVFDSYLEVSSHANMTGESGTPDPAAKRTPHAPSR